MDVTRTLEKDHREAESLFDKIEQSPQYSAKRNLYSELREALMVHMRAEEEVLYPRAEQLDETRSLTEHSEDEHAKARGIIRRLDQDGGDQDAWSKEINQLKEAIEHHVEEEEEKLFPKLREILSKSELEALAREVVSAKGELKAAG